MEWVIFEENKPFVLKALRDGEFTYTEVANAVYEAEFFRFIQARKYLEELAQSYPMPRKKEEVPFWFYVASNLSMRLHGVHAFHAFPLVVRDSGMLQALGPKRGCKVLDPETGATTVFCEGFNRKNHYDRQTPCDSDYLRKMAKDTRAQGLMTWFNQDVMRIFRKHRVFDSEGIFVGDGSYLFVPDNPNYEGSVKMCFDEHNHPVRFESSKPIPKGQKGRCQWKRCYKMVTLLHTNRKGEFFLWVAVKVISGKSHESPVLYELVEQFVQAVGPGVMKRLLVDRAFLDGEAISRCKEIHGIDVLIPIRHNMDLYEDAAALFREPEVQWVALPEKKEPERDPVCPKPKTLVKREKKTARNTSTAQGTAARIVSGGDPDQEGSGEHRRISELVFLQGPVERGGEPGILCRWPHGALVLSRYEGSPRSPAAFPGVPASFLYGRTLSSTQMLLRSDPLYLLCLLAGRQSGRLHYVGL